jgi:hypothetical protein
MPLLDRAVLLQNFLPSFTSTHTRSHVYARLQRVCMGMGEREKEGSNTYISCAGVKEGSKSNPVFFRVIRGASFPSFTSDSFTPSFTFMVQNRAFLHLLFRDCGLTCFSLDGSFPQQPVVESGPAGRLDRLDLDVALLDQRIDKPLKCFGVHFHSFEEHAV